MADNLLDDGAVVSQGLAPVPHGASKKLAQAITDGSHAAFMAGLHTTRVVAGFVALAGATMGPLLRPRQASRDDAAAATDLRGHEQPEHSAEPVAVAMSDAANSERSAKLSRP